MPSKSKLKGSNFERTIVNKFKEAGHDSKRAYASNGQSLGLTEDVDVVVYEQYENLYTGETETQEELKIQCKVRKKLPEFLGFSRNVDAVCFKMNAGDTYIMLRLDDFIEKYL